MTHCSYVPEVIGVGETKFVGNGLRFATAGEAINYARDLQSRWMGCKGGAENRRARETSDPITHRWVHDKGVETLPEKPQGGL